MHDKNPIPISEIQESTRQAEARRQYFVQVQSIVKTVGEIVCRVVDSLTCHTYCLKVEVQGSPDEWKLVFLLELK
jgi:hypothetical protein